MKKMVAVLVVVLSLLCSTVFSSAASDPAVILVNPANYSTVSSNSLLISVKITAPKKIRVTVFEEQQLVSGTYSAVNVNALTTGNVDTANLKPVAIMGPEEFTSTNNLSFYTKQINGRSPGLYMIRVESYDSAGRIAYKNESYVAIKEKAADKDAKIFDTPQSGTMQFLQNLLKTIFGD